jgi:integrase
MARLPRQVSSFDFYAQRCRWTAAAGLATAAFTGLRKGELRGLRWENFAVDEMQVTRPR